MKKISIFLLIVSFFIISCSPEDTSIYPLTYKYARKMDYTDYHSYLIGEGGNYNEITTEKDYKENLELITDDISHSDWDDYIVIENDSMIIVKEKGEEPDTASYKSENGFLVLNDKQHRGIYAFDKEKQQLLCFSLGHFVISKKYQESSLIYVSPPFAYDRDSLVKGFLKTHHSMHPPFPNPKKIPTQYYLMPNDTLCMVWGKAFYNLN